MAKPLSTSDSYRGGLAAGQPRYSLDDPPLANYDPQEIEVLRSENAQLRQLCEELEQALEQSNEIISSYEGRLREYEQLEGRLREYEQLVEEKSEVIRTLHQRLEEVQAAASVASSPPARTGPTPREEELLALSEELERERRQLKEDEEALEQQMRQMEMSMARERAEMARQRNDLQRLYGEVRHELERLERNGATQAKLDELRSKLQDVANRRGAAPDTAVKPKSVTTTSAVPVASTTPTPPTTPRPSGGSFMGRLFGGK